MVCPPICPHTLCYRLQRSAAETQFEILKFNFDCAHPEATSSTQKPCNGTCLYFRCPLQEQRVLLPCVVPRALTDFGSPLHSDSSTIQLGIGVKAAHGADRCHLRRYGVVDGFGLSFRTCADNSTGEGESSGRSGRTAHVFLAGNPREWIAPGPVGAWRLKSSRPTEGPALRASSDLLSQKPHCCILFVSNLTLILARAASPKRKT